MAEKWSCAAHGPAGESRVISGRANQSNGSRASQRRVCGDGVLEKRVAEVLNARPAARAPGAAQATRRDSGEQGVHPMLMRELTAIWQQADTAYSFGGEWQRSFALGEIADRLAVIISDGVAFSGECAAPAVTERLAGDMDAPASSDGFDALRELLELEDLRDTINDRKACGDDGLDAMVTEYEARMSLAWARARRVVARGLASGQYAEAQSGAVR
ncbi:hypothetical protein [Paraburkholderia sp. BCC1876]|uniref:hypothetical protein n=1 Tax=Paraburkholderia sp. BCC1876 TaxID=2676303 RepID=UPI00159059F5|nr:hypothetical protein [Paraburkholderia sp. BCC1876]